MSFFDDVNDAMSRDSGLRTMANVGRQAMGDTSWRQRPGTVDQEDADAYAAQGKANTQQGLQTAQDLGDRMQRKYFTGLEGPRQQPPSFDPGQVQGKQVYNTYDPDRPASMGAQGNNPWQDMARQLATFSELRNREPMSPGFNSLTDQNAIDNAEKTQRWAMEDAVRQVPFAQRGQAMLHAMDSMQGNQTQRRGQDINAATAANGAGLQARGQDMQLRSHLEGLGLQGRNQRELAGIQSQNQLENTRLGYSMQGENQEMHDMRSDESARGLAQLRQKLEQDDPLKSAQATESKARARMLGTQADAADQAAAYDKTEMGHLQKYRDSLLKSSMINSLEDLKRAVAEEAARLRTVKRLGTGKAEGGVVETPEQVMARIQAKYGVSGNAPQQQAPVQAPQPVRQQAQPQPTGGLMDRLRNVATGGLDRRMQGYADGGEIQALKAKIAGFEKAGQDYTAKWNSQNVSGIGGSGGYGSFTNSNGTSFGEGSTKSIGSAVAGNNWSNVGNGAVPSWQRPVDQGYGAAVRPDSNQGYGIGGGLSLARSNNAAATDSLINYANDPYALQVYAEGGPVDVGGRSVHGEGDGKSDSLPAVIDGEHPAALSSGEFVMPIEAVRHFGLDRLNKMVAAARKGLDTGRESA